MITERFATGHPLCGCPELTFTGGPNLEQIEACRERSHGITHRVVSLDDLRDLRALLVERNG